MRAVNPRWKLLLLTLGPLLLALGLSTLVLLRQQADLAARQQALIRETATQSTQEELRHYVALALSTISPLYNTGRDDEAIRRQAMDALAHLDYGPDGYFFLYDYGGRNLMHPRQPELVGRELIDLRDARGLAVIRTMVDKARVGGGFVEYTWNKPSSHVEAPKLAYVTGLERWGWMLGTGIYTDDLDRVVTQLNDQLEHNLASTLRWAGLAGLAAVVIGVVSVLGVSLSELRAADAKLTLMARQVVSSQEQERARLSRELHDGTGQVLVSARLLGEAALERLPADDVHARPVLERALARVQQALDDVRGLSHRLRPAELDAVGLATALRRLCEEIGATSRLRVDFEAVGSETAAVPDELRTALFRLAQEGLSNALRHAHASCVRLSLSRDDGRLRLVIEDDGQGFDPQAVALHPSRGIGLRNMRERLAAVGGSLHLRSDDGGTRLVAEVPWPGAGAPMVNA